VVVLGVGGTLKLPETGYEIVMKPGDVAIFLASQQLHMLTVDSTDPDAVQTVLTFWTDRDAITHGKPSERDVFYGVRPDDEGGKGEFNVG
jgi:hypothetical protein